MTNKEAAEEFRKLLDVSDILLGPEGCPWDREQTLVSMRESILEEACEVIEAIDECDDVNLIEELGDLLYNVIFFSKLAEKESRFKMIDSIHTIYEKLIARHPHVFKGKKLEDAEAVVEQWEEIKKKEKSHRESLIDGIPKGLPALARVYKVIGHMIKSGYHEQKEGELFRSEEELGELLWAVAYEARRKKMNPELALRKKMLDEEREFRHWEKGE